MAWSVASHWPLVESGLTGVDAVDNGTEGLSLKARDGRNVSVWFEKDSGVMPNTSSDLLTAAEFGLGYTPSDQNTVKPLPGISHGLDGESRLGATFYAGVVLQVAEDGAVLFDFNHPLAGQPVTFEVHVIGVL